MNLLNLQAASGKRSKEFKFGSGQVEPCRPIGAFQHDDLTVVDRSDIGTGSGGEDGERLRCIGASRSPKSREAEPILARLREAPFGFRRLGPGELEEVRGRHEAPPSLEPPAFRAEVDDGRSLGAAKWKAPTQLSEFYAVRVAADYRRDFGRPDVVPGSRFGAAAGRRSGNRIWLNASTYSS